jgi:InsA-like protein
MVSVPVQCPHCQSTEVIKAGKQANGAQRYQCQNEQYVRRIFLLQYQDRGRAPEVRRQVARELTEPGNWLRSVTILGNGRPRGANASISHSVRELNGWRGKRSAFPNPCRCMTS